MSMREGTNDTYLSVNYADLHRFSVTRLDDFWKTLWDYTTIIASVQPTRVYLSE